MNHQTFERILRFRDMPGSMPVGVFVNTPHPTTYLCSYESKAVGAWSLGLRSFINNSERRALSVAETAFEVSDPSREPGVVSRAAFTVAIRLARALLSIGAYVRLRVRRLRRAILLARR